MSLWRVSLRCSHSRQSTLATRIPGPDRRYNARVALALMSWPLATVRRSSASRRSLAEHCHSQSPAHTHYRTHILGLAHIHASRIASHSAIALSITHHPSSHSFSAPQAHGSLHHVRFTSCHAILAARPHTPAFPLPLLSATPAPASSPEPSPPHGTAHTCTHPLSPPSLINYRRPSHPKPNA